MKLLSTALEKKAIRTICSGTMAAAMLLATLNTDSFAYPPAKEAYERISTVLKKKSEVLSWEDLLADPAIEERTRKEFVSYKKKPYRGRERAYGLIDTLTKYKKIRGFYYTAEMILKQLKKSSVDVDKLSEAIDTSIHKAKIGGRRADVFHHIGKGNNTTKLVNSILADESLSFIPTGFKTFDNVNRGLALGDLMLIAASTGGGKSTMALQMGRNMAEYGASVANVSLEMTQTQVMMRRLANLTQLDLSKFLDPTNKMNEKEKLFTKKKYKEYQARLKKKGSRESYVVPDEDITMEEVLFLLKPYAYDVIIIDYVGLLKGMSEEDQWRKLSEACRFGKRYAAANNCLVIICAQLSEEGMVRYSRGMVEHAANCWTWVYNEVAKETGIIDIEPKKSRNQVAFPFQLMFEPNVMTMRDLTEDEKGSYDQDRPRKKKGSSEDDEDDDEQVSIKKVRGPQKTAGKKKTGKPLEVIDYFNI